jgi:hypothetical protein
MNTLPDARRHESSRPYPAAGAPTAARVPTERHIDSDLPAMTDIVSRVDATARETALVIGASAPLPALVIAAGERAGIRFLEFFASAIRNLHTRRAYARAVGVPSLAAVQRRSSNASGFFVAGRSLKGWQNGLAVSGDYMSAASFLGIAGLVSLYGFDGLLYSFGFIVGWAVIILLVAEPLRNSGKYTLTDVMAFRLNARPVRAAAAISSLTIGMQYLLAQLVGAGVIASLLLPVSSTVGIVVVGVVMIIYVLVGGMVSTTYVQIFKAVLVFG